MIVSNWTMKRFHIASLLVLVSARVVPCMPVASPPPPSNDGRGGSGAGESSGETDESRSRSTPATPEVERVGEEERDPEGEEGVYFQGDIRLLPYDDPYDLYRTVFKRMVFDLEGSGTMEFDLDSFTSRLWPDGRIPYRFASHLKMEYRHYFAAAMDKWSRGTCLTFDHIGDVNITEDNYIVFTDTEGCSSYVGMIGGPQEVSIDRGCVGKGSLGKGHAMHELGHAIGLWHEHSRWDRNTYIHIVRENVRDRAYYNFGTISQEKWPIIEDPGYDLLSIMHYGANSFSKNDNNTIEPQPGIPPCAINSMGQRRTLSRRDKIKTSRMYQCENETSEQDNCDQTPIVTTPPPPPPTTTPPPSDKLMNSDALRLTTNASQNEFLFCSEQRCRRDRCTFNPFIGTTHCEPGLDFTIHHFTPRKNRKIKNRDVVNLQSLHKQSRWLECSGQNICSISDCPANTGAQNASNISECEDQRFVVMTSRTNGTLKDGRSFMLKHISNETYLYCNSRWCDLLPVCEEGVTESQSHNRNEVTCHTPTTFYVKKVY